MAKTNVSRPRKTLRPPLPPMEAAPVAEIPMGDQWQYEPKWDGFRCLVFRDGESVYLQSKSGQPLARYFPEVVELVRKIPAKRFVLDTEIVVPVDGRLSFDELLLRIHPAASRVQMLSQQHPARLIVFDLLSDEKGTLLVQLPLQERRELLEQFAKKFLKGSKSVHLSPAAHDLKAARKWRTMTGGNLDGVMAKRLDLPYRSGTRDGMQKIKWRRTADCVVGGFRYATGKRVIGSLLLGLYDAAGLLHHVGFTSSFAHSERAKITKIVQPLRGEPSFTGRAPGGPSRWSTKRSTEWVSLTPKLVIEVEYDHFTGERFRHGTKFLRWRGDKSARDCTFDQIGYGEGLKLEKLLRE